MKVTMKTNLFAAVKLLIADRLVAGLTLLIILLAIVYCVYVGVSLQPSDVQVAVHYTAFGSTNFYRNKWYYLISFIVFGATIAVVHTALILKLYALERRQLAIFFAGLTILMLLVAWAITRSVLMVAFL
jgi:hypothetical protein